MIAASASVASRTVIVEFIGKSDIERF
jgi:hypothetical protein